MNNARKLPDAYNKTVGSNLYNLLQLLNLLDIDLKSDLKSILESRNIENATGATLDAYGEMVGVKRNCTSDENYRTRIIARISTLTVDSDTNSVLYAIARTFGMDISDIKIIEGDSAVTIQGITPDFVTDCSCNDIVYILKSFMPVGVTLNPFSYGGTIVLTDRKLVAGAYAKEYPYLCTAWSDGFNYDVIDKDYSNEICLSGHGEVPFVGIITSGDFVGGTLAFRSND